MSLLRIDAACLMYEQLDSSFRKNTLVYACIVFIVPLTFVLVVITFSISFSYFVGGMMYPPLLNHSVLTKDFVVNLTD